VKVANLLSGARIVTPDGVLEGGWVAVDAGRIAAIGTAGERPPDAAYTTDLSGMVLMPGAIDPHTHPGNYGMLRDELRSETRSAALGGLTTIMGIVKSTRLGGPYKPLVTAEDVGSYLDVFDEARDVIERDAYVDVGLTFIVMGDLHAAEIPAYAERLGVTTFKFFPSASAPTRWHQAIGTPSTGDDGATWLGMRNIAAIGGLATFHPENNQISRAIEPEIRAEGRDDLDAWERRSPAWLEAFDIHKMTALAGRTGARIYPVHVNSREGLAEIRRAKANGVPMTAETCPRYLVLTKDYAGEPAAIAKIAPPLRSAEDRDALWEALADGTLDTVGSDHSPMSRADKGVDNGVWAAKAGLGDVGTLLPLMYSEGVGRGRISLERLVEVCASNPARAFGLYPRKGAIVPGADADLVVIDPDAIRVVRAAELGSICDFSPYEGMQLRGVPVRSWLRGEPLLSDGAVTEPRGTYLSRTPTSTRIPTLTA
jgi:dihydroorotase-like cyclic amidohydrolase